MCGVLAVFSCRSAVGLSDVQIARMRDTMSHRGPDGAGLWRSADGAAVLAHRRLAVIDPTPDGAQPMVTADGRWVICYNGELYNDAELREQLADGAGVRFRTRSDTETMLAAISTWGADAFPRLRGMYGLIAYDTVARRVLVARDPLGIKPLYWWTDGGDNATFVVASEAQAILAHPDVPARPDLATISSYLTTIRTTLGSRTLFEGIHTVLPGEVIEIDLARASARTVGRWKSVPVDPRGQEAAAKVGAALRDSISAHLRSDVPVCALLSGGIDSTVIARCAAQLGLASREPVRTYCSGFDDGAADADLACAQRAAAELGTVHTRAPITQQMFLERWAQMVNRLGTPLSTPNEVAINEVARRLRADGRIVALSGEGADELLAGYDLICAAAATFEQNDRPEDAATLALRRAMLHVEANAWVPPATKHDVLSEGVWRAGGQDAAMRDELSAEFAELAAAAGPEASGLDVHLRYLRRINLAGLLQRLDTATMLESVEGRTPFADVRFAELAESLPVSCKFAPGINGAAAGTKLPLRAAFAGEIPEWVLSRPKASFPLPFTGWLGGLGDVLRGSAFASAVFAPGAVEAVAQQPAALWRLAWPMLNLAMWGDRWWGSGSAGHEGGSTSAEPRIELKASAATSRC